MDHLQHFHFDLSALDINPELLDFNLLDELTAAIPEDNIPEVVRHDIDEVIDKEVLELDSATIKEQTKRYSKYFGEFL